MKEHIQDAIRAAVIIEKDRKFLLVQEGTPKIYGLWNWQQGRVEEGENPEEAAVREAKEETGFDVSLKRKLTILKDPFPGTKEIHVFLGEIIGGELQTPPAEILQARWFALDEIEKIKDQMPGAWVFDTIGLLT
jgi:8-oxo-dGTP diphosphatase